ncbi:hypothetical protein D3C71_907460 [compost metagenome]
MKTKFVLPLAIFGLLSVVAIAFNSCQKEINSSTRSEIKGKKKPADSNAKSCNYPTIENGIVGLGCSNGRSCSTSMIAMSKRHEIYWNVGTQCSPNTPYSGTSNYGIYKQTAAGVYSKIDGFSCASTSGWYASALLTNSSTFILVIKDGPGAYPTTITEDASGYLYDSVGGYFYHTDSWKFTTGTGAGTSCL